MSVTTPAVRQAAQQCWWYVLSAEGREQPAAVQAVPGLARHGTGYRSGCLLEHSVLISSGSGTATVQPEHCVTLWPLSKTCPLHFTLNALPQLHFHVTLALSLLLPQCVSASLALRCHFQVHVATLPARLSSAEGKGLKTGGERKKRRTQWARGQNIQYPGYEMRRTGLN